MIRIRDLLKRSFWFAGAILLGCSMSVPVRAADLNYPPIPAPPPESVACDVGWAGAYTWLPAYWSSVWMAHFSGGISHYDRWLGVVDLVWGNEKRCFPSYRACNRWVTSLRREFHRPEGYWTCMVIR